MTAEHRIVVAGHICLDIIPAFLGAKRDLGEILVPGSLSVVGPAAVSTGGAVSNTGVALHKLGVPVTLIGKVGDDYLGMVTRSVLESYGAGLSSGMVVQAGEGSSYSIVLNPPGVDRMFLHHPGPNDTFGCDDVGLEALEGASLFHFGYPPLMRRMYEDEGRELERLFLRAKQAGLVTALDMTMPDPASDQGRAPWREILRRVLPAVDLFLPSVDEVAFMLCPTHPPSDPDAIGEELLSLGASSVLLKLGERGLALRVGQDRTRLGWAARFGQDPAAWAGLSLRAPAFRVEVLGTTGCGDSTVAGFLASIVRGLGPTDALDSAAAAGACTAERPDALSGVPCWDALRGRMAAGWARR